MTPRIRPFRPEDRDAIVAIDNRDRPPHRHTTAAAWERMDARKNADRVDLRLCIGDPETDRAIAFLSIADLNTTGFKMEDVCEFDLTVAHAHRRRGLGSLLYARALEFAQERGAKRLITWFREWSAAEPALHFLQKRGFAEQERETPSYLNLTEWDAVPPRPLKPGVRILSYAEAGDTDENRHKLYELQKALIYDIPRRDDQPFTFEPYDDWLKFIIDRPDWRPDLCVLAEADSGGWVGQCHVMPKMEQPSVGMQWLTGVSGSHRGQGLATALKVAAYKRARASEVTTIVTENHEDNAPMLAINRKFGFIPEPAAVSYNKVL